MNYLIKLTRFTILGIISGIAYMLIEIMWRGYTHISMFFVGGISALCIWFIIYMPVLSKSKLITRTLLSTAAVLIIEFLAGCVINLWLDLNVWNYSDKFGNIYGQICLMYSILWFMMIPFAVWLQDTIRWHFWKQGGKYSLLRMYINILLLK